MSHTPFMYKGIQFRSVEQAYQWTKVTELGYPVLAQEILITPSPFKVKKLAKSCLTQADKKYWREVLPGGRIVRMMEILCAKWDQVEQYRVKLLSFRNHTLLEDTLDPFWGIGCHENHVGDLHDLPGENWMGRLLMILVRFYNGARYPGIEGIYDSYERLLAQKEYRQQQTGPPQGIPPPAMLQEPVPPIAQNLTLPVRLELPEEMPGYNGDIYFGEPAMPFADISPLSPLTNPGDVPAPAIPALMDLELDRNSGKQ